jgi:peptidyl-prolyl cis-trans isomerase C
MIVVETKQEARTAKRRLVKESFEDVARAVSTGLEASRGGDLGFFGEGDMPPEFEEVVFKMAVGRISNIIKTPYGHHIFKVEEKRKGGVQSFNEVKDEIISQLKREKFEKAYHNWITTLQQNTHIEINEEQLLIKDTKSP